MDYEGRKKKYLVIGGAKSGKTRFALRLGESLLGQGEKGLYVATMRPLDEEMKEKALVHKRERSNLWDTLEEPMDIPNINAQIETGHYGVVLVDCLTLWLLNVMEERQDEERHVKGLVRWFKKATFPIIMVTNEIGLGIVPETSFTRRYRDRLGTLNQQVAQTAHEVILVIAGLTVKLKGGS